MFFTILLLSLPFYAVSDSEPLCTACSTNRNYSLNSQFETNLKLLFQSFSSNSTLSGFYDTQAGSSPDVVYGQFLCRGDTNSTECQRCVENASAYIYQSCKSIEAVTWYELCQISYSFQMLSIPSYTGKYPSHNNQEESVAPNNPARFMKAFKYLMDNISHEASFTTSRKMFATGEIGFLGNEKIFGLVQCTRDISQNVCSNCLDSALGDLTNCCSSRRGGIVFSRNCNVRFEAYRFYNTASNFFLTYRFSKGEKWKFALVVFISAIILVIFLCSCIVCFVHKVKGRREGQESEKALIKELTSCRAVTITEEGNLVTSEELPFLDLVTIKAATDDFADANMLGQGGFGAVYKGVLEDGREVAVKRLSRKSWQGLEEFKNEVILIARLQHRNLVRLVGCGIAGEEKLLLYEFMPNRSLDFFIFDSERRSQLSWETYHSIICGIARGLLYLHEDSRLTIIHRDLKPSNVLLDNEMVAKISDFGMARIFSESQSTSNTKRAVGTYGYMAPEYAMSGMFSIKSDVFSFGVIVLEIISGLKNNGFYMTNQAPTLLAYAWRLWKEGNQLEFLDTFLKESSSREDILRCLHIGLLCVQEDPADRPTMSAVVALVRGSESVSLPEPTQPAFSGGRVVTNDIVTSEPSVNEVTISAILPR